jgi:hypothetical protein
MEKGVESSPLQAEKKQELILLLFLPGERLFME